MFSKKNTHSVLKKWDFRCFGKNIQNFCLFCLLGIKEIKIQTYFQIQLFCTAPPPHNHLLINLISIKLINTLKKCYCKFYLFLTLSIPS